MAVDFEKFGFYNVDFKYIQYLYSKDSQVYYENCPSYSRKPYLGLIVQLQGYTNCLPLTSAKDRQLGWANVSEHTYIIYEVITSSEIHSSDKYRRIGMTDTYEKLLGVLEIRKMIPVDNNLCEYIDFSKEPDANYKNLLEKEYNFLHSLKIDILKRAAILYNKQITSGIIKPCYCNFKLLEDAYLSYMENNSTT